MGIGSITLYVKAMENWRNRLNVGEVVLTLVEYSGEKKAGSRVALNSMEFLFMPTQRK